MKKTIVRMSCQARVFSIAATLLCATMGASAQTVVSSFAPSTNTDPGVWFESDVRPGGSSAIIDLTGFGGDLELGQPAAVAAARLTTDFTNAAKGEVGVLGDYGVPDDVFSTLTLSYAFHKSDNPGQNAFAAASVKLTFFNPLCDAIASGGDCFMQLVYEPYLNGPTPALDIWTTVNIDENTGLFWSTGGFGTANSGGGPPLHTLADWRAILSSDFGNSSLQLISVGVGSYNQGQIAYFDKFVISHGFGPGLIENYDFDLALPSTPMAVPLAGIWLVVLGFMLMLVGSRFVTIR